MYPVQSNLSRTFFVRLLNFSCAAACPHNYVKYFLAHSYVKYLALIIFHSYVKYFAPHNYVKFLTCQDKPSKLPEGLTYLVCNIEFRHDFSRLEKCRNIGGLIKVSLRGRNNCVKSLYHLA